MNDAETALPSWCMPPPGALGRDALVAEAVAQLRTHGEVWLRGAPAAGTSVALGLVARAGVAGGGCVGVLGIRAHTGLRLADAARALAVAAGVFPADRLAEALGGGRWLIVVDDADLAEAAVRQLQARFPGAVWALGGRLPGDGLAVEPLSAPPANDDAPPGIELYGGVPMGVAGTPIPGWAPWLVPQAGRVVLRRSAAERFGGSVRAEALSATLRDDLERVHRLACDLGPGRDPDDIAWLRACAERATDPELGALAAAAAARLLLRWTDIDEAADMLEIGRARVGFEGGGAALLAWLEGDVWAARGAVDAAEGAHQRALEGFVGAGLLDAAGALAGRNTEELVRLGFAGRSRRWSALARESFSVSGQPGAWADTLRVAAEAAAAAGEIVGAATLLDEADAMARRRGGPNTAGVSIALARAGIEVARGAIPAAEEALASVDGDAAQEPMLVASLAWRRADLDLRRSRRGQAAAHLDAAREGYVAVGSLRGLRLVHRLEGDRRALGGDLDGAVAAWTESLRVAIAERDLEGARRALRRLLAVERHTEATALVDDLRERLAAVEAALRMR